MKNRIIQIALSLAMLVLLVQIVLIAPGQIRDAETKAGLMPSPAVPESSSEDLDSSLAPGQKIDQSMQGMHMIETQEGKKEWELWADKASSVKAKNQLHLQKVKAVFFSDSGVTFTVTGNRGLVNTKGKDLFIEGDVITRSSNGYEFRTESMDYASKKRILRAANQVAMRGPKDAKGQSLNLTGKGMHASLLKSTMEILSDVRAEKGIGPERKAYIRSHRSQFSGKDRTARFIGNVILDMDSMRITGPEAQFAYDSASNMVKTAFFTGGARVSDTQKWATAQNVNVDFETNRFVFRGNPRVVQNNDELRGREIVFIDGGKRIEVQGARAEVDERGARGVTRP